METIVGTAGHIDHGKTALVRALTGIDADRLPEEKSRGITIDLGFAEMTAGETHFGFVDVPGHERFVRNMLAGATGVDIVLLVVAADEGVMPQTREHFDICRLLDIRSGVVALTKSDLVDDDTLELAKLDVAELVAGSFLERAPMIGVSVKTGAGIDDVRNALLSASSASRTRNDDTVTRLPVDRSFSIKGFGTVVTGTLASGTVSDASKLELMPIGTPVRVRGVQTHGNSTKRADAGQRTAVNLANIDHDQISRGMTLVDAGTLKPTQAIDAEIELLADASKPLRTRQRVRVHIGTAEILARLHILNDEGEITPGSKDLAQLRLESPVVAVKGERFIIRSYSPEHTIGGGVVIDPLSARHRRKDLDAVRKYLSSMSTAADQAGTVRILVGHAGKLGTTLSEMQAGTGLRWDVLSKALEQPDIVEANGRFVSDSAFTALKATVITSLDTAHKKDPLAKGVSRETIALSAFRSIDDNIVTAVLQQLVTENKIFVDDRTIRLASHMSQLSPQEIAFREKIISTYQLAGLEVPRIDEAITSSADKMQRDHADKLVGLMVDDGELVKVTDEFYFARTVIDATIDLLRGSGEETIEVPRFKEMAGVSRKYAIPLLEYFDRTHITARVGDKRVILK